MSEFNLSDKICEVDDYEVGRNVHPATRMLVLELEDVKEFIRLLKEEFLQDRIKNLHINNLEFYAREVIDNLAGDKLI
jgi:hypothetical protein